MFWFYIDQRHPRDLFLSNDHRVMLYFYVHFFRLKHRFQNFFMGTERICSLKYLFLWNLRLANLRLASKKTKQIFFFQISYNWYKIFELLSIEVITPFQWNILNKICKYWYTLNVNITIVYFLWTDSLGIAQKCEFQKFKEVILKNPKFKH